MRIQFHKHQDHRKKWLILTIILVCLTQTAKSNYDPKCDRTPTGHTAPRSEGDNRFLIRIHGNSEKYVPGEVYIIKLAGITGIPTPQTFSGFLLAAERQTDDFRESYLQQGYRSAGTFSLIENDQMTKISEKCRNAVEHTSSAKKSEIQVRWTAPPTGSGCVVFRATVVIHPTVWFMDDGPLSKTFCEDDQSATDFQPSIMDPCCACDEAKYELTFEGLWSRHTHPKDFPTNGWLTRFSDIIGASHTKDYRFWEYGKEASEGVKQVAEHGSTRMLETELKTQSEHIRTIIKARGISYPNVTGKTFAVFRVDSSHHLISLISMIDPSPDWIVGLAGLELCTRECSWIEHKELKLYPWDAGTDSGPSYISPDQPTNPQESIRRIKSTSPNDPRSPFYDETGTEMKPMARVIISRQRLYEKKCDGSMEESTSGSNSLEACKTTQWGDWEECDAKCGKGHKRRQRYWLDQLAAETNNCKKKLFQRTACEGAGTDCDAEEEEEEETQDPVNKRGDAKCALNDWSDWSGCSAICGKGTEVRTRTYVNPRNMKKCIRGMAKPDRLEQTRECQGENCSGDITSANVDESNCKMTPYSRFTECSVTCGSGQKVRTRDLINRGYGVQKYGVHRSSPMYDKIHGVRSRNRNRNSNNEDEDEENEFDQYINDPTHPCYNVKLKETVQCDLPPCENSDNDSIPEYCLQRPKIGNCRNPVNRWYYVSANNTCSVFTYSGCGGNKNSFESLEKCLLNCGKSSNIEDFENFPIRDQRKSEGQTDCNVTNWVRGPCNVTCGSGFRTKTRKILTHPMNGGRECPKKFKRFERCEVKCGAAYDTNPAWGPTTIEVADNCEYSDWGPWSHCSQTCGEHAKKQRTRHVLDSEQALYCNDRVETKSCNAMPCRF